mmetsp:Transcript_71168/g.63888  ORF Transcript_71168/g.63888 Transcript_71168/m.63888 type:complete len:273 (-) Transcript_71168:91-909(-)
MNKLIITYFSLWLSSSQQDCNGIYSADNMDILALDVCTNNSLLEFVISTKYQCENNQIYHALYQNTGCNGAPSQREAITTQGDIQCNGTSDCPYAIIRTYQSNTNCDDNTEWNDIPFIVNVCQTVEVEDDENSNDENNTNATTSKTLSCDNNIGLTQNIYDNDNCDGTAINSTVKIAVNTCATNEQGANIKFIKCGQERHVDNNGSVNGTTTTTTTLPPVDDVWFITSMVFICLFGVLLCGSLYLAYAIFQTPNSYESAPQREAEVETMHYA